MGIDPAALNENILRHMTSGDRKKLGKRGMTRAEAVHIQTTVLERKIHDQFSGFCHRHGLAVWHSSPVKRSSIKAGLPDFLIVRRGRALLIEFKVPPNDLSAVQKEVFAELEARGDPVHVIEETSPGEAYRLATLLTRDVFLLSEGLE